MFTNIAFFRSILGCLPYLAIAFIEIEKREKMAAEMEGILSHFTNFLHLGGHVWS